ncbi:MAG: carbamoyltransferase HypF [Bacteroidia bacterium]|nr:carbamoyltransferase HypF [Bacteroidia bacterium]
MAEHNLDEKVIGVSFDGTGYGDDGNIWGGEFLICDLNDYKRYAHFDYIPLPGGDKSVEEPWRIAVSYLYKTFGGKFSQLNLPFFKKIKTNRINSVLYAIDNKINCPLTSSAGRLFDAVAAIIDLCPFSKFHAEAPMRLESVIDENCNDSYNFKFKQVISFENTIKRIVDDVYKNIPNSIISTKFHNTVISAIFTVVQKMNKDLEINKVALSGGVFQNRYILTKTEEMLSKKGYQVFTHSKVPSNDGGIALGQIAIAGKRRGWKVHL